ncbi:hypothetical protein KC717_01260 [Candidatus Dojkabacteria bacterium]|uniref:Uncharacterized protein n=1 Tax=Candidatus Dojkabacteria bacterium TaxID=2099670 RepID=A0A955RJZ7_9BACT|nr:hypothetical protein [Candidatus Dojkabacteria bacterium]
MTTPDTDNYPPIQRVRKIGYFTSLVGIIVGSGIGAALAFSYNSGISHSPSELILPIVTLGASILYPAYTLLDLSD